ncbi:hypothetical protein FACUT_13834 [Fusarium acutatum]|uniref:Uncharacterized protein n=1 Tax=Fusarium acutatum TaxID=78861 RepID=A0A8H4NDG6_9HYPO|nr:hypothetical protein FACUT_13834 [Fusarium acutatum]
MAGDTALAIVALAPALAAVILTDRGWKIITLAARRGRLLYVDANLIRAFILMAAKADYLPRRQRGDAKDLNFTGVVINRQIIKMEKENEPDVIVLHLQGTLQRTLSKPHVQRILNSYPPLSQDPWQRSIFSESDLCRGGWIAAIGLDEGWKDETSFLPIYVDSVQYNGKKGGLFWRSIDRIIAMLSNVWLPVFQSTPGGDRVKQALIALTYMREGETESGFENLFNISFLKSPPTSLQRRQIIDYFNSKPTLGHSGFVQFRQDWEALLDAVLVAAVLGTSRCVAYVKNPGREMNLLPLDSLLDSSDIYIRGC